MTIAAVLSGPCERMADDRSADTNRSVPLVAAYRRSGKSRAYLPRALLLSLALFASNGFAQVPTALRTEFLENPLGLDTTRPRFSWIVEDPSTGARQTAYQLQLASSLEKLVAGVVDLWDSGKVTTAKSARRVTPASTPTSPTC